MTGAKRLVLDANILLRAVFGVRALALLRLYEDTVSFYSPDLCFIDARRYVPEIAVRRGFDFEAGLAILDELERLVNVVDKSFYGEYEDAARARIGARDQDDWPIIATALLLDIPIWTEDRDFFGTGLAIWTSDRVELYLQELKS